MRFFVVTWLILLSLHSKAQVVEKSYVTTDREVYAPGDTLWFKAYVFTPFNRLSDQSVAFHLIISDENGMKVNTSSWPIINALSHGNLVLPHREGSYILHAYSGQMAGSEADFVFQKDIFVRSDLSDEIAIKTLAKEHFYHQDSVLKVYLSAKSGTEFQKGRDISYELWGDKQVISRGITKTNDKGLAQLELKDIPPTKQPSHLLLKAQKGDLVASQLKIPILKKQQPIDLQFFPEGGDLIAGISNNIAFKAINSEGLPIDFEGDVIDQNGEKVISISSFYKGMGNFKLTPQRNATYFFQMNNIRSDIRYELPNIQPTGISITLDSLDTSKTINLMIHSSKDLEGKEGTFELLKNELSVGNFPFNIEPQKLLTVPVVKLVPGIYRIRVHTSDQVHQTERLVFIKPRGHLEVSIQTEKKEYRAREKVKGTVMVKDSDGNPVSGEFSIGAIYKTRSLIPSYEQPNLLAQILLKSDLKGHIPTPNFYFSDHEDAMKGLNLVLLTNGWRKYKPSSFKDAEAIVGKVNILRKTKRRLTIPNVNMVSIRTNAIQKFELDSQGKFEIGASTYKGLGGSLLIIPDKNTKKNKLELSLDSDLRYANSRFQKKLVSNPLVKNRHDVYSSLFKVAKDKFQGVTLLNSVNVTANGGFFRNGCSAMENDPEGWITKTSDQLDMSNTDLVTLLQQVSPNVEGIGGIKISDVSPKTFSIGEIDGVPTRYDISRAESFDLADDAILVKDVMRSSFLLGMKIIRFKSKIPYEFCIDCQCADMPFTVTELKTNLWGILTAGEQIADKSFYRSLNPNEIDFSNVESISIKESDIRPMVLVKTKDGEINKKSYLKSFHNLIAYKNEPNEFYTPSYKTQKAVDSIIPDARNIVYWDPKLKTNKKGIAKFSFYNADRPQIIQISVEGIATNGQLGARQLEYRILDEKVTLKN